MTEKRTIINIRQFMEANPGKSLDVFSGEGYLFITPESFQRLLNGEPLNANPGCSGCARELEADFVLGMECPRESAIPDPKRPNVMCVAIY